MLIITILKDYDNFDDIFKYLYRETENGFKYLVTKIGKAYTLYCKKWDEHNNKNDIMK